MQVFTAYPKIAVLSFFGFLICCILIRVLSSSLLEFKQRQDYLGSGKEKAVPGKGKSWSSAGSAENRRAIRNALRIGADIKLENGNNFAEVFGSFHSKGPHETLKRKTLKTHFSSRKIY